MTRQPPARIKHTFAPPQVCTGCYWEERSRAQQLVNKQLRAELTRLVGLRRGGRKPAERDHDDERDPHDVPDLIDQMSGMGKLSLEVG